ncbi:MAG: hypothetical protein MJE77_04895 [Proteobacteria bacterium]|nr:hypothetical protein [Pseudomonadota bacterium]
MNYEQRELITNIFRDVTLRMSGVFSVHHPRDELVWAVTRELRCIFDSYVEQEADSVDPIPRGHPAVLDLLDRIDRIADGCVHTP